MKKKTTPLGIFQARIDKCNQKLGCDAWCTKHEQKQCKLLKDHEARRDFCSENNIPIWYW